MGVHMHHMLLEGCGNVSSDSSHAICKRDLYEGLKPGCNELNRHCLEFIGEWLCL